MVVACKIVFTHISYFIHDFSRFLTGNSSKNYTYLNFKAVLTVLQITKDYILLWLCIGICNTPNSYPRSIPRNVYII